MNHGSTQPPPPESVLSVGVNCERTGGAVVTVTGVVVELVDTRSSVLTWLTVTLVNLTFTPSTRVAGLAVTRVVISSVNTLTVETHHAHTVVWVYFATTPVVT